MMYLGMLLALLSLAVTLAALYGMGRRHSIGDEAEYLGNAGLHEMSAQPFLRMPLLTWLVTSCQRAGVFRLRLLLVALSIPAVVITAMAGWHLGGFLVALASSALLLLQPERILLACHVWPDGLVSLMLAAVTLLLLLPRSSGRSLLLALGLVCALGILARIDFFVVPGAVWASLHFSGRVVDLVGVALLFVPTLLVLAWCTARNYREHGVLTPDNTWTLNLMITGLETERWKGSDFALEPIITETFAHWHAMPVAERSSQALHRFLASLRNPGRFLGGVGRRLLTLCGPDTFFREKILPRAGAYPELDDRVRRGLDLPLRVAFPLLVTLALLGAALRREFPAPYTWPAFSLMAVAALFFARTRIRVALLPVFSLLAGEAVVTLATTMRSITPMDMALLLSAPLLFWALVRIRCSRELPT